MKTLVSSLVMAALMAATAVAEKADLKVGDKICTTGYIMDSYCIDLGTLFDNRGVFPLSKDGVQKHSVHCLIDVPDCIASPWEIIQDISGDQTKYGRVFRAQDNQLLIDNAKIFAGCEASGAAPCKSSQVRGYNAAVTGEVVDLGRPGIPATLKVTEVGDYTSGCPTDGSVITDFEVPKLITESGRLVKIYILHGILMILAWAVVLPMGAFLANVLKRRKKSDSDSTWFQYHKYFQIAGLLIATTSFIIILVHSTAIDDTPGTRSHSHASLGVATMTLGFFQPFNAFLRPHPPKEGERKSSLRFVWELLHKGLGYSALIMAVITIVFGTMLLPTPTQRLSFQIVYGVIWAHWVIGFFSCSLYGKIAKSSNALSTD